MRTRCEDKEKRADMKEACFESKVGSMYACIVGVSQGGRGEEQMRTGGGGGQRYTLRAHAYCVCVYALCPEAPFPPPLSTIRACLHEVNRYPVYLPL